MSETTQLSDFIGRVKRKQAVEFSETITIIEAYYSYQPVRFENGFGDDKVINNAGSNEGSCKIFAFAMHQELDHESTLALFGECYRSDVKNTPNGSNHANIRIFMKYGWDGVRFVGEALTPR